MQPLQRDLMGNIRPVLGLLFGRLSCVGVGLYQAEEGADQHPVGSGCSMAACI